MSLSRKPKPGPATKKPAVKKPAAKKPAAKKPAAAKDATAVFWAIIDRVGVESDGNGDEAADAFGAELEALDDQMLLAVEAVFSDAMMRVYRNDLWGAAYVIHGGVSEDMFWDFRAGLVALGKKAFEAALADPDSLADIDDVDGYTLFEGFQYAPGKVIEERGLESKSPAHGPQRKKLAGPPFNPKDLSRYPRLRERFADQ